MLLLIDRTNPPFYRVMLVPTASFPMRASIREERYALGREAPRYPVPSVIHRVDIEPGMVMIHHTDEWWRMEPIITWYSEEWARLYNLVIPCDHGIASYDNDIDQNFKPED